MTISGILQAVFALVATAVSFSFYYARPKDISFLFIGGFVVTMVLIGKMVFSDVGPTLSDMFYFRAQEFYAGLAGFALGIGFIVGNLLGRVVSFFKRT